MRDLEDRFVSHTVSIERRAAMSKICGAALGFAEIINNLCPASRERSLALTKLEEAMFWADAGIARGPEFGLEAPNERNEK